MTIRRPLAGFRPLTQTTSLTARRCYPGSKEPSGDYGSGTGDPKGEKPLEQGPNPSADKEHPGPPPPDVGKGSGTGTKIDQSGSHEKGNQKRSFSTLRVLRKATDLDGAPPKDQRPKSTDGLQPKILDESKNNDGAQSEDVKKHNEEFEQRHEKAAEKSSEDDKVSKDFWKGMFSRVSLQPG